MHTLIRSERWLDIDHKAMNAGGQTYEDSCRHAYCL
jgi:hypothetical protein